MSLANQRTVPTLTEQELKLSTKNLTDSVKIMLGAYIYEGFLAPWTDNIISTASIAFNAQSSKRKPRQTQVEIRQAAEAKSWKTEAVH